MAAEQRKLLGRTFIPRFSPRSILTITTEQLMGEQLMAGSNSSRAPAVSITDPKVCRSYLCGTCPHDLFTNTKQDFGPCPKIHSEPLKAEYEAASDEQKRKWGFEYDYLRDMGKYVGECDRRIDAAQRRLEKTPDEIRQTNSLLKQIGDLQKTINGYIMEIEILAEGGSVALALAEFQKMRVAQVQKAERERELKALSDTSGPSGHQKLQVCDVCGAYLSRLDNDRRLADHFYGKMHLGYAQMRKSADALAKELRGRGPPPVRDEPREDGFADGGGWGGRGGFRGGRGGYGRGGGFRGGRGGYSRW